MSDKPSNLLRSSLAQVFKDQRTLKAIEDLISQVNTDIPDQLSLIDIILNTTISATEARSAINRLKTEVDDLRIELMSLKRPNQKIEEIPERPLPNLDRLEKRIADLEIITGV